MLYNAEIITASKLYEFEGFITIKLDNELLYVSYQAPYEFAIEYIHINEKIPVDIWLLDGKAKIMNIPSKQHPNNPKIAGGIIEGQVKAVFSSQEFRIDSGLLEIDIGNDEPIELRENDFIETSGTYQIFFPGTEWSKEECWGEVK